MFIYSTLASRFMMRNSYELILTFLLTEFVVYLIVVFYNSSFFGLVNTYVFSGCLLGYLSGSIWASRDGKKSIQQ